MADNYRDYLGIQKGVIAELGILNGNYIDFIRGWYVIVGSSICVTMVAGLAVPYVILLLTRVIKSLTVCCSGVKGKSQLELNHLAAGEVWSIEARYASVMVSSSLIFIHWDMRNSYLRITTKKMCQ